MTKILDTVFVAGTENQEKNEIHFIGTVLAELGPRCWLVQPWDGGEALIIPNDLILECIN